MTARTPSAASECAAKDHFPQHMNDDGLHHCDCGAMIGSDELWREYIEATETSRDLDEQLADAWGQINELKEDIIVLEDEAMNRDY